MSWAILALLLAQTRVDPQQIQWRGPNYMPDQADSAFFHRCDQPMPAQVGTRPRWTQVAQYGWKILAGGKQAALYGPAGVPMYISSITGRSTGTVEFRFLGTAPNFNLIGIPLDELDVIGGRGHVKITAGTYTYPPMLTFTVIDGVFTVTQQAPYIDTCSAFL